MITKPGIFVRKLIKRGRKQSGIPSQVPLLMLRLFSSDEKLIVPKLNKDFYFVHFTTGLEQAWMDILNDSGEFGRWDAARLNKIMVSDLLPQCGVLIFNQLDKPVACAAVCAKKRFEPYAVLMNVVVLPNYRGLGISMAMVSRVLEVCRQLDIPGVALLTEDFRLPAIRLYLKLGFKPDMAMSLDAPQRWEQVLSKLDHGDR